MKLKTLTFSFIFFLSIASFGQANSENATTKSTDYQNKVAVLPFSYTNVNMQGKQDMGLKIQEECNSLIRKNAKTLDVQDIQTTNALLLKSGINNTNIQDKMTEICRILNVEYVVQGIVTVDEENSNLAKQKKADAKSGSNRKNKIFTTSTATPGSSAERKYITDVAVIIYDINGKQIFSQNKDTSWSGADAYNSPLKFLLKKTPIYEK